MKRTSTARTPDIACGLGLAPPSSHWPAPLAQLQLFPPAMHLHACSPMPFTGLHCHEHACTCLDLGPQRLLTGLASVLSTSVTGLLCWVCLQLCLLALHLHPTDSTSVTSPYFFVHNHGNTLQLKECILMPAYL